MSLTKTTYDRVKQLLIDQLGVEEEEIFPGALIEEDLGADSLDCVEIVMALEEEFKIEINDDQMVVGKRVKDIVEFIDSKIKT